MTPVGLPHSEISGSMRACRSPKHIAACHVFHRLSVPRHPPSTLSNLTIKCLDLMRSAACISKRRHTACISYLQPVFNCQRTLRSRRPTLNANHLRLMSTVCPHGATCSCLLQGWITTRPGGAVFRLNRGSTAARAQPLVELIGIEPTTLCLQSRCSPS